MKNERLRMMRICQIISKSFQINLKLSIHTTICLIIIFSGNFVLGLKNPNLAESEDNFWYDSSDLLYTWCGLIFYCKKSHSQV